MHKTTPVDINNNNSNNNNNNKTQTRTTMKDQSGNTRLLPMVGKRHDYDDCAIPQHTAPRLLGRSSSFSPMTATQQQQLQQQQNCKRASLTDDQTSSLSLSPIHRNTRRISDSPPKPTEQQKPSSPPPRCKPSSSSRKQQQASGRLRRSITRSPSLTHLTVSLWLRPRLAFEFLARKGSFNTIRDILSHERLDDATLQQWLYRCCGGASSGHGKACPRETPLHRLLMYRPPASLVDLLARKLTALHQPPDENNQDPHALPYVPEYERDDHGRTPLHVAAAAGCNVTVIERLLEGEMCNMPAIAKDDQGRCPLHWACTNPSGNQCMLDVSSSSSSRKLLGRLNHQAGSCRSLSCVASQNVLDSSFSSLGQNNNATLMMSPKKTRRRQFSSKSGNSTLFYSSSNTSSSTTTREPMTNVIRLLVQRYPEATLIADQFGYTPTDLAMQHGASPAVIQLLRETQRSQSGSPATNHDADNDAADDEPLRSHPLPWLHMSRTSIHLDGGGDHSNNDDDLSSLGWEEASKSRHDCSSSHDDGNDFYDNDHTDHGIEHQYAEEVAEVPRPEPAVVGRKDGMHKYWFL